MFYHVLFLLFQVRFYTGVQLINVGFAKGRIEGKTLLISIWTWKTFASKGNKKSASKWCPPFFRPIGRNQKKISRNKQYDTVHKDPFACANLHFFHSLEYSYKANIRLKSLGFNNYQLWEVRNMQTFLSSIIFSQTAQMKNCNGLGFLLSLD